jgi:SpoVK/Ycf46/Vps4 family AAA+-type ATPase
MNISSEKYLISQCGKLAEELKKAYLAGQNIVYIITKDYSVIKETINIDPIFFLSSQSTSQVVSSNQSSFGTTTKELKTVTNQNLFYGIENLKNASPCVPSLYVVTVKSHSNDNMPNYLNEYLKYYIDNLSSLSSKCGNTYFKKSMVLIVSPNMIEIPREISLFSRIVRIDDPSLMEIQERIETLVNEYDGIDISSVSGGENYIQQVTNLTKGLALNKVSQIYSRIKSELDKVYIPVNNEDEFKEIEKIIIEEKSQLIESSAILKLVKTSKSNQKTSGMGRLSDWLNQRRRTILKPEESMTDAFIMQPKGILLAGIPGTGKSLAAKTTSGVFGNLPLLQLDMGNIMDKYQGESEHKMEDALKLAEAMSPCVLWIDEIEKGIAGASSSSGGSESMKRIFGKLLTWMQEKEERGVCCFVFATANSIDSIPPELFRSGRFDEKFYTFLPSSKECIEIFMNQLRSQNKTYKKYCESSKQAIRELFDPEIISESYIFDILESQYVLKEKMDKESTRVSKENKFMTGSDIEAVIQRAKLIIYNNGQFSKKESPVFTASNFRRALHQALTETRTYSQTNAKQIAECFTKLSEYNFQPVSKNEIVPFYFYNSSVEPSQDPFELKSEKVAKHLCTLLTEYDRQLFLYIGISVNQYFKKHIQINNQQ